MKTLFPTLCVALAASFLLPVSPARAQSGILLRTFNVKAGKLLLDPSRPRLYATLPADNSLAVIDTDTNTVLTTCFIGSNPVDLSISPDGTRLYVANNGSTAAAIGVVNLTTLTTLTSLPAPFKPVGIAAGLGNRLYVLADYNDESAGNTSGIAQLDAATGTLQGMVTKSTYEGFIRLSPDFTTLFYANSGLSPSSLEKFDVSTATPGPAQTGGATGSNGEDLTISHNGNFLVFPNGSGNGGGGYSTALIPTDNLAGVLGSFNTGAYPGPTVFSADDSLLYEVQFDGGDNGQSAFKIFSTQTFTQLDSFVDPNPNSTDGYGTNPTSLAISASHGYLYVAQTDGTFNNTAGNLELLSTQRAPFFDGSVALSDGFYYLKFADGVPFGYYNFNYSPYLYHDDLGFEYPFDAADGKGGIYLYDFTSGTFFYTSSSLFPYLYDFSLGTFLYYFPDPSDPNHYNTDGTRYFYDFATKTIISK